MEVTIEGIPNQLYSQGMRAYQMWDEANERHPEVEMAAKDIALADVNLGEFSTRIDLHCGLTSGQAMMTAFMAAAAA